MFRGGQGHGRTADLPIFSRMLACESPMAKGLSCDQANVEREPSRLGR